MITWKKVEGMGWTKSGELPPRTRHVRIEIEGRPCRAILKTSVAIDTVERAIQTNLTRAAEYSIVPVGSTKKMSEETKQKLRETKERKKAELQETPHG